MKRIRFGCRAESGALAAYLDGRADSISRIAFESHVESCADCRRAVALEQVVEEALHRDAGSDFDAGFEARILAGVNRALDSAPPRRAAPSRRIAFAASIAAVVTVAVGIGLALRTRSGADDTSHPAPHDVAEVPLDPVDVSIESPHDTQPIGPSTTATVSATSSPTPVEFDGAAVDAAKLADARASVKSALVAADGAADFRGAFDAAVSPLAAARWPIHELVRGAIDDPDPVVAAAAVRGAVELRIASALPSLRRAARRPATASQALIALGALGDASALPQLERALADRALAGAACESLRRVGTSEAARALSRSLDAAASDAAVDEAIAALIAMGGDGIAELVLRADHGDLVASEALRSRGLPDLAAIEWILRSSGDSERIAAAIRVAARRGDLAITPLLPLLTLSAHRDAALSALVDIGSGAAFETLLATTARGVLPPSVAAEALRRALAGFLDPTLVVVRAAGAEHGATLVAALAESDDQALDWLTAIAAAPTVPLERRVDAAFELADRDRLDSALALAILGESIVRGDASLLGTAVLAAARAEASLEDIAVDRLRPSADPGGFSSALQKASQLAERWRRDGSPPTAPDRDALARRLERSLPTP